MREQYLVIDGIVTCRPYIVTLLSASWYFSLSGQETASDLKENTLQASHISPSQTSSSHTFRIDSSLHCQYRGFRAGDTQDFGGITIHRRNRFFDGLIQIRERDS